MKRIILFSVLNLIVVLSLWAQNTGKKKNLPREDSKVTREFDEHGNLTRFDSVYTYSWSGDTTLINSIEPKNFPEFFGNNFKEFNDSTWKGKSFFDEFDQLFAQPFEGRHDSILMKQFDLQNQFKKFGFKNDSMFFSFKEFDDLFNNFNRKDSTSIHGKNQELHSRSQQSMTEMMKRFQKQIQDMEERQRKLFEKHQEWNEF